MLKDSRYVAYDLALDQWPRDAQAQKVDGLLRRLNAPESARWGVVASVQAGRCVRLRIQWAREGQGWAFGQDPAEKFTLRVFGDPGDLAGNNAERPIALRGATPPQRATVMMRWLLPHTNRSELIGDLEEEFWEDVVPEVGYDAARRWYWFQAIRSILAKLPKAILGLVSLKWLYETIRKFIG